MGKTSWRRWGAELRRRREALGVTQRKLARDSKLSTASISSFETGARSPRQFHAELLDNLLDAKGELVTLWHDVAGEKGIPESWRKFDEIEREATELREFHPTVIPGILQTPEYAEAIMENTALGPENDLDRLVAARIKRFEATAHARRSFVLNEQALWNVVGSRKIQADQVARIRQLTESRTVHVGIIPRDTPHHPCPTGGFRLITLRDGRIIGHEEHLSGTYVATPGECQQLNSLYGALQAEALPRQQTLKLLETIEKELRNA